MPSSLGSKKHLSPLGIARKVVQLGILALFISVPLLAGIAGIAGSSGLSGSGLNFFFGTLTSSTIFQAFQILDPYAALEVLAATWVFTPVAAIAAAVPLLIYALIGGRAFCGWVCPVGLLLELEDGILKRLKFVEKQISASDSSRPNSSQQSSSQRYHIDRHTKVIIAGVVLVLSALTGLPVFELISPVGAVTKLIVLGSLVGAWSLIAVILLQLFTSNRLWCRSLCPLGGFYQLVGHFGFVHVKAHTGCTGCGACKKVCLANPEILDPVITGKQPAVTSGDCMLCGRCSTVCPCDTLHIGLLSR